MSLIIYEGNIQVVLEPRFSIYSMYMLQAVVSFYMKLETVLGGREISAG